MSGAHTGTPARAAPDPSAMLFLAVAPAGLAATLGSVVFVIRPGHPPPDAPPLFCRGPRSAGGPSRVPPWPVGKVSPIEARYPQMPQTSFATDAHPSPDQLADFGRGAIAETLADDIERHLADCASACKSWKSHTLTTPGSPYCVEPARPILKEPPARPRARI